MKVPALSHSWAEAVEIALADGVLRGGREGIVPGGTVALRADVRGCA